MMKKEMLFVVLVIFFVTNNALSMETPQQSKPVKMFHCTREWIARLIIKEGLKSRSQLVREGKASPSKEYLSFPDHDENIYFQYVDENDVRQIEPGLWYNMDALNRRYLYCIAMEFDPDETMVYNPDLRFWPPENNCQYDCAVRDPVHASLSVAEREDIYKKFGMTLRQYVAKKERFDSKKNDRNCFWGYEAIQDPFAADLRCVRKKRAGNYTEYRWNEHTIKKDRIDPTEFVQ